MHEPALARVWPAEPSFRVYTPAGGGFVIVTLYERLPATLPVHRQTRGIGKTWARTARWRRRPV